MSITPSSAGAAMATVSVDALVQTLRQCQLLKPAELAELTDSLQNRFPEPQALAKELCRRGWLTPFQARQFLVGKGNNLVLGPYVLLDLLGAGARGQVFKARHRTMGRLVALKVLHKDLLADEEAVQRFFREVEVISQLAHPAIVHAYDADTAGASYYLAMEYVEGVDLERLVKDGGRLPAAQACDFTRQAALGLQYAHERGLVHRDIKPSNLLLAKPQAAQTAGLVKILDLGLARLQKPVAGSRTQQLTVLAGNQVLQGTPDYLAPEQALDFHNADIRSDIYSLGCTFFYLLTGQPPFPGGTLPQKLMKHQMAEPPSVERPDLPPGVPDILRKMLAKKPDQRYQTPGEVAEALTAALKTSSLAVTATPTRRPASSATLNPDSTLEMIAPPSGVLSLPSATRPNRTPRAVLMPGVFKDRWPLIAGGGGLLLLLLLASLFLLPDRSRTDGGGDAGTPAVVARADKPALAFDGKTTVIPLPDDLLHKSKTLSIEAWFKTRAGGVILGYQVGPYPTGGGSYVPVVYVGTDGLLRGEVWFNSVGPITSKFPVNDDRWHHVCLAVDGTVKAQRLYLDGTLIGTINGDVNHLNMLNNQLGAGVSGGWPAGNGWHHFTGALAEVRVWSKALSAEEVQQNRSRVLTGKEPGLVIYLPLDEAGGDVIYDRSPSGLKLKLFKDAKAERVTGGPPVK